MGVEFNWIYCTSRFSHLIKINYYKIIIERNNLVVTHWLEEWSNLSRQCYMGILYDDLFLLILGDKE